MIILGVDPAIRSTGYAIVKVASGSTDILDYGCVETQPKDEFPKRLKTIYDELNQIIKKYQPDVLVIEEVFYLQNIQIAIKMGHARGVAILSAVNNNVEIYEYSPREVKLAVTGNGAASKKQVQQMVMRLLGLTQQPASYDVTDALALTICHCNRLK